MNQVKDRLCWILFMSKGYDFLELGSNVNKKVFLCQVVEYLEVVGYVQFIFSLLMRKLDEFLVVCRWCCIF